MRKRVRLCIYMMLVLCLFAIGIAAAWGSRIRISAMSESEATTSDVAAETAFGKELAARILGTYPLLEDDAVNRYVNLVGRAVARYSGRSSIQYYFGVLDTEDVNAFAVPGGYIFLTAGALRKMNDEAQLAAVLGHEIAHVELRHAVKELQIRGEDNSAMAGFASLIGGATGSYREILEQGLDQAFELLFERGYKVEDELAADRTGVMLAFLAGYEPTALAGFLADAQRFEVKNQNYKGDHPFHQERVDLIHRMLVENGITDTQSAKNTERFHAKINF